MHIVAIALLVVASYGSSLANALAWQKGMRLRIAVTHTSPGCPATIQNLPASYQVLWTADGSITEGPQKSGDPGDLFYLTQGWSGFTAGGHDTGIWDLSKSTEIRAAEPIATGGPCLTWASTGYSMTPCTRAKEQGFSVSWDDGAGALIQALGSDEDQPYYQRHACFYEEVTSALVTPPASSAQAYYTPAQITNLTVGSGVPDSSKLTSVVSLPGCYLPEADSELGRVSDVANPDCIVAKAYNSLPAHCQQSMDTKECLIHVFPAFCADHPFRASGVDACFDALNEGPCVANPAGAACASGLFVGIKSFVNVDGSVSAQRRRRALKTSKAWNHQDEIDFLKGAMKNIINSGIGAFNFFTNYESKTTLTDCIVGVAGAKLTTPTAEVQADIRDDCRQLFSFHEFIKPLPLDSTAERAGSLTVDVLMMLTAVGDVIKLAEWAGITAKIMSKFEPVLASTQGAGVGLFLKAVGEAGGEVFLWKAVKDAPEAALPITNEFELTEIKSTIEEEGFVSCVKCAGPPVRMRNRRSSSQRLQARREPVPLQLCCNPNGGEPDFMAAAEAQVVIPEPTQHLEAVFEGLLRPPNPSALDTLTFNAMARSLHSWYMDGTLSDIFYGDFITSMRNAIMRRTRSLTSLRAMYNLLYGYTPEELGAFSQWFSRRFINHELLVSGFRQMDPVDGLVVVTTDMSSETFGMLSTGGQGLWSHGEPGLYELRDLTSNPTAVSTVASPSGTPRQIMTGQLGFVRSTPAHTNAIYVIHSKSARYTALLSEGAVAGSSDYHLVAFIDKLAGKFKLIGMETLDGEYHGFREAGRRQGVSYVVYLREIEVPDMPPLRVCGSTSGRYCRQATLRVPSL